MAGGQERVLRQRIRFRALDAQDHQSDGADRRRADSSRASRASWRTGRTGSACSASSLEAALGDPAGAKKLLALPDKVDRAIGGRHHRRPRTLGPLQQRLVARRRASRRASSERGHQAQLFMRGQKGRLVLSLPRHRGRGELRRLRGSSDVRRRPGDREPAHRALSSRARPSRCCSSPRATSRRVRRAVEVEQLLPLVVPELPELTSRPAAAGLHRVRARGGEAAVHS